MRVRVCVCMVVCWISLRPHTHRTRKIRCLANNSCIADTFEHQFDRFQRLYSRRAMMHHYTQYTEGGNASIFEEASESIQALVGAYRETEIRPTAHSMTADLARLVPMF